ETIAFDQTRRDLRKNNLDFKDDELRGISYLDDFEGFENTFSLKQPGAWRLSSSPDSIYDHPDYDWTNPDDSLRSTRRATMAWYQLNATIIGDLCARTPGCDPNSRNFANEHPEVALVHTNW